VPRGQQGMYFVFFVFDFCVFSMLTAMLLRII
jgi:hypothetical protein